MLPHKSNLLDILPVTSGGVAGFFHIIVEYIAGRVPPDTQ